MSKLILKKMPSYSVDKLSRDSTFSFMRYSSTVQPFNGLDASSTINYQSYTDEHRYQVS